MAKFLLREPRAWHDGDVHLHQIIIS